ncbi:MAG: hypothetical protein ABSA01_06005 [Anaerolineales bacterium]
MKNKILFSSLLIVMLVLSACAAATPVATAMPVSTAAPVIPNTGSTATMAPVASAIPMATATMAPAASAMPAVTATMAPIATPSSPAAVNTGQNATLGSILVDSNGMTLYLYTKDTPNTSVCYGNCATLWPPLLTNGAPVAGTGVTASMLGTTTRTDGTVQVTYNGWPLYYFAKDKVAGDTTGEGVGSVWYVITPAGMQK